MGDRIVPDNSAVMDILLATLKTPFEDIPDLEGHEADRWKTLQVVERAVMLGDYVYQDGPSNFEFDDPNGMWRDLITHYQQVYDWDGILLKQSLPRLKVNQSFYTFRLFLGLRSAGVLEDYDVPGLILSWNEAHNGSRKNNLDPMLADYSPEKDWARISNR